MRHSVLKYLALAFSFSAAFAMLAGCTTASRNPSAASSDPDAYHKSMRGLPKVTNAEAGGYAASLTDELYATLNDRSIIKAIVLERYKEEATIKLVMDDDACFGPQGNTIKRQCAVQIQKMGGLLSAYHQTTLQIVGHTDSRGSKNKKTALSRQRADAISKSLTRQGLSSKRVAASSIGQEKPVFSNDTASGRQYNRRVELVINIMKAPSAKTPIQPTASGTPKTETTATTVKPLVKATTS